MADGDVVLDLDGHEVRVSSPGKVFFSERGETKLDLVNSTSPSPSRCSPA